MKYLPHLILSLFFFTIFYLGYEYGLPRIEKSECLKWQALGEEMKNNPHYFVADWMREQCKNYQINL